MPHCAGLASHLASRVSLLALSTSACDGLAALLAGLPAPFTLAQLLAKHRRSGTAEQAIRTEQDTGSLNRSQPGSAAQGAGKVLSSLVGCPARSAQHGQPTYPMCLGPHCRGGSLLCNVSCPYCMEHQKASAKPSEALGSPDAHVGTASQHMRFCTTHDC